MEQYQQILKDQFSKLSPTLRDFISHGNWSTMARDIAKQFDLTDEKYASFENEILFVLICLQQKEDFTENIKKELEIDSNMTSWIAEDVNKNIFSRIVREIDLMWKSMEKTNLETEEQKPNQNRVGANFEQIILNQARAMQPAVAQEELGSGVARPVAPDNLPTENNESKSEAPKITIPDYSSGDPYREPTE